MQSVENGDQRKTAKEALRKDSTWLCDNICQRHDGWYNEITSHLMFPPACTPTWENRCLPIGAKSFPHTCIRWQCRRPEYAPLAIAKILVRDDPWYERVLAVRGISQQRHPQAAPCLTARRTRLDLLNVRDVVPNSVELVDPVVAAAFTVPAHQRPQHCDDAAHTKVHKSVQWVSQGKCWNGTRGQQGTVHRHVSARGLREIEVPRRHRIFKSGPNKELRWCQDLSLGKSFGASQSPTYTLGTHSAWCGGLSHASLQIHQTSWSPIILSALSYSPSRCCSRRWTCLWTLMLVSRSDTTGLWTLLLEELLGEEHSATTCFFLASLIACINMFLISLCAWPRPEHPFNL